MVNYCKNCGTVISDTAKFCPECGTKIERELKCANCGTLLAENAKFCMECGFKVDFSEELRIEEEVDYDVLDNDASSVIYVNEVLPFSDVTHRTPNGETVLESEFSVVYTLPNGSNTVSKILGMVNKYNQRALKYDYPLFDFNQSKMELKGCFCPIRETPDMNFFKKIKISSQNGDLCEDFLKICKLCETVMIP